MDKIAAVRNLSFKATFIIYVILCLLVAAALSALVINIVDKIEEKIYSSYSDQGETYYLTTQEGEQLGSGAIIFSHPRELSREDSQKIKVLRLFSGLSIPFIFSICIIFAAFLFYQNKLKEPLALLTDASMQIEKNNLDFTLQYNKNDEMGQLCHSFEKMRAALKENNLEMWRRMDQHKRLNAAFSHDLRTPLTVLKGQSDMLLKYVPDGRIKIEKIVATLEIMKGHIDRLESYVTEMNRMQKLEDIAINKADIPAQELLNNLKVSSEILCSDKQLEFHSRLSNKETLFVDQFIVMEVYENLLSNAVRFAKNKITVSLSTDNDGFSITVSDDGQGFSNKDLMEATKPFYQSHQNEKNQHLGMGLNICKVLCERHGGFISLFNHDSGASVRVVF